MYARIAKSRLTTLLKQFPAVALLGPRQSGKTTLARSLEGQWKPQPIYLDLKSPAERAKFADPELYLAQHADRLVILDEIHRLPGIFQVLRRLIDRRSQAGRQTSQFLLLGSAAINLLQQPSELLARRIAYLELTPLTVREVSEPGSWSADQLWLRGGFPESLLARDDQASFQWRSAFIQTYMERDVPAFGPRVPADALHHFWQMLAHHQGQMLNAAQLAAGLAISGHTVARYLDLMVDLLLVRRLQPWPGNKQKRLVRTPKVYVRDSGILHALLGIRTLEELFGHPIIAPSWEGLLLENILSVLPASVRPWFYRTSAGAEIDLVLEFNPRKIWAIEIKRSIGNPGPSKGFHIGCADLHASRQVVLYPGQETRRIDSHTEVMPLTEFVKEVLAEVAHPE